MVEFDIKMERFRDKETGQLVSGRMFKNAIHAAATIRRDAKKSFKPSKVVMRKMRTTASGRPTSSGRARTRRTYKASPAGKPPGKASGRLVRSIVFEADNSKMTFVVGPRASTADQVAKAHEFGGIYKGGMYDARPFMKPALDRNMHRFAGQFAGRIGG